MSRLRWKLGSAMLLVSILVLGGHALMVKAQAGQTSDGEYAIKLDSTTNRNVVYRVADDAEWYRLPTTSGELFLSTDGTYAAECVHLVDSSYRPRDVVVQFYRTGSPITGLRLNDLLQRVKNMQREGTHSRWGLCTGFTSGSSFEIITVESQRILYDPATGRRTESRGIWPPAKATPPTLPATVAATATTSPTTAPPPPASSYQPDEFCVNQEVDDFCDDFKDKVKPGWKQVRGKWEPRRYPVPGFKEWVLHQKSDLQREGNALMFYDNQVFSDANISTLIRMDLDFPQLAIDEDDLRIRRMRRIAGAGVVFRLQDENNYYMFRLAGEEGAVLGKMVNGEWHDLSNPRAIDFLNSNLRYRDQWYGLRIRLRGSRIECFITEQVEGQINVVEQAVVSLVDSTFSTGRVGLVTFEAKADFLFLWVEDL